MNLMFSGKRWPRAVARKGTPVPPLSGEWPLVEGSRLEFEAAGKEVAWTAIRPSALWRSFPSYNASVEGRLRFIRRHGDPESRLNTIDRDGVFHGSTYYSTTWSLFAEVFSGIARDWSPPDADGISRFTGAGGLAKDLVVALNLDLRHHSRPTVEFDQVNGWQVRFDTLFAFMSFSAVDNWKEKTPMRACLNCSDWFVLHDQRSRFCSGACRTAFSVRGKKSAPNNSKAG